MPAAVTLAIVPDTGLAFALEEMEATEALGRPFLIVLDVSSATAKGDLHAILGSSATVTLTHPTKAKTYFNGIVSRIKYRGLVGGAYRYRLELRPWIWVLSKAQDCRIFTAKSVWTIIGEVCRNAGFTEFRDSRQSSSGDAVLDYCVQYRESSFDFVTRLMEQFGIYYYVEHKDGAHTVVFCDDPNSHTALAEAIPYDYDQANGRSTKDHMWDWSAEAQLEPGGYTVREYNFTTPKADLTSKSLIAGRHEYGTNEVYDYPGLYETALTGQAAAAVRMQDLDARRQTYGALTNARGLNAGKKFTVSGFSDASVNREYLVTESVCSVASAEIQSTQDGDLIDTYRCVLKAVPGDRQFRLPDTTPRPMIRGPQTARVTGEAGQEITTDKYGRIKVKFPWDRSASEDENSSCWIRVAQVWAGTAWGAMFIPRIGQEVIVEFLEGNPDRPLVTGQVYNADITVPYDLPGSKTRSTMKSNSSPGGAGFNELRFEDNKGAEEVFLQAQKDFNIVVLNTETAKITQDRTVTIEKGNDTLTVFQGNRNVTVSQGNNTATIAIGNDGLTVSKGDHTVTVTAGNSTVSAGQSITLKVGGNSIKIDTTGITISAAKITITATGSLEASGMTTSVAGQAMLKLDGGPMAELTGGLVKIN